MQPRLLTAARFAGSIALTIVAIFSVDMPEGYLGPAGELTGLSTAYAGILVAALVLVGAGVLKRVGWVRHLVPLVFSVNIGLFVPALVSDPLVAALVTAWHLALLVLHLVPERTGYHQIRKPAVEAIEQWWEAYGPPARHLVVVSIVLTIVAVGFELSRDWEVLLTCFALHALTLWATARYLWLIFDSGQHAVALVGVPLVLAVLSVMDPPTALSLLAVFQALTLVVMVARGPVFDELLHTFFGSPALLIVSAFLSVILLGTVFLTFPAASATGVPIDPLDALFTATSATCVTGLIVLDTPVAFSTFGHVVILSLIQIGGLGIMVLSTFGALIIGGRLGLRGEKALGHVLEIHDPRSAYRLTSFIVASTLISEAIGAALLTLGFRSHGLEWSEAAWRGIFHSISAFCNAGFALQSDSIVMFQENPLILAVFMALITLGGLGFIIMAGVWSSWTTSEKSRWTVQAKLVLLASVVLVALGFVLYLGVEWDASLGHLEPADRVVNALFQSVTLRTAGFNSVDLGPMRSATVLFTLFFMYVGASPGSTGGGIKTTTAVVLLAGVSAIARGEPKIVLFNRRISQDIVYRSAAIAVISVLIIGGGLFVLLLTEDIGFEMLAFEVVSAIGTVGLSLGATGELGAAGKFVIIFVMFAGRIGPLTLALLLGGGKPSPVEYPRASIMVG